MEGSTAQGATGYLTEDVLKPVDSRYERLPQAFQVRRRVRHGK